MFGTRYHCAATRGIGGRRWRAALLATTALALAWTLPAAPARAQDATWLASPGSNIYNTASVDMKWRNGFSVRATFEGEFSNVTRSYGGKGVVRYVW